MAKKRRPKPRLTSPIIEIDCRGKTNEEIVTELVSHGSGEFLLTPRLAKAIRDVVDEESKAAGNDVSLQNPRPYTTWLALEYSASITNDQWQRNGDAIRFQGILCKDGQHRCAAVQHSGKAIVQRLVTGITEAAVRTIDRPKLRNFAHTLHGMGYLNTAAMSAVITKVYIYDNKKIGAQGRVAKRIADDDLLIKVGEIGETYIDRAMHFVGRHNQVRGCPTSVLGASYIICARLNCNDAEKFFDLLFAKNSPPKHQATKVRVYFDDQFIKQRTTRTQDSPLVLWGTFITAWNNWRNKRQSSPRWKAKELVGNDWKFVKFPRAE